MKSPEKEKEEKCKCFKCKKYFQQVKIFTVNKEEDYKNKRWYCEECFEKECFNRGKAFGKAEFEKDRKMYLSMISRLEDERDKAKQEGIKQGKAEAEKDFEGDLLRKDNHILGCMLECYVNILEYRGFIEEARQLEEIASKLK